MTAKGVTKPANFVMSNEKAKSAVVAQFLRIACRARLGYDDFLYISQQARKKPGGIGNPNPGAKLEVNGNIKLTPGSGGSVIFADGTTQSTAFIPANCGADYAESVSVSGDRTKYEPGDILVIDPSAPGKFLKSNQAYSTMVAGIYSTKPGFVGRLHPKTRRRTRPRYRWPWWAASRPR